MYVIQVRRILNNMAKKQNKKTFAKKKTLKFIKYVNSQHFVLERATI